LTVLLAAVAVFMLVPVAHAAAATLTVKAEGGGAGEVSSVGGFAETGLYEGEPPIECSYESPGPAEGTCSNTMFFDEEEGLHLVALHANAAPGSEFVQWKIKKGLAGPGCNVPKEAELFGTCIVISFGAAAEAVAVFEEAAATTYPLFVTKTGGGTGVVTSSPTGINCGATCAAEFNENTVVTLTPSPGITSEFKEWTGACSGAGACEVTMSEAKSVNARFAHTKQTLTVGKSGTGAGSIKSKPKGVVCGATCSSATAKYYNNTVVVLTEKPASGSTFTEWTGACSGSGETCTVTMSAAKSVTAVFGGTTKAIVNPQSLTVSKATGTGYGTVKGTGIACELDCTQTVVSYFGGETAPPAKKAKAATVVTLSALPGIGSSFSGWTGCDEEVEGKCLVSMSSAHSVSAQFNALPAKALSLTKVGYGAVKSKPKGVACGNTCTSASALLPENTVIVLTQKAGTGATFTGWSGACSGAGETCSVTMSEAKSVTATFSAAPKPIVNAKALTLTKAGTGKGTVKATGIACELDCTQTVVSYFGGETAPPAKKAKAATLVTLIATPALGSDPVSWSGCDEVVEGKCVVSMSAAKSVTATFEE
jgi:hypothetical protein